MKKSSKAYLVATLLAAAALSIADAGCARMVYKYHAEGAGIDVGSVAVLMTDPSAVIEELRRIDGVRVPDAPWGGNVEIHLTPGTYRVAVRFDHDVGWGGYDSLAPAFVRVELKEDHVYEVGVLMTSRDTWRPLIVDQGTVFDWALRHPEDDNAEKDWGAIQARLSRGNH